MATQNSDLVANSLATPRIPNAKDVAQSSTFHNEWALTGVNGVDGEIYQTVKVQANQRVIARLCRLNIPLQGVARVLAMGHAAFTAADGTTVAADAAAFFSALDVATAVDGLIEGLTVTGLVESFLFTGDALITLTITGDTAVAGAFAGSIVAVGT